MGLDDIKDLPVSALIAACPPMKRVLRRMYPDSYEQFLEILYEDVDEIVLELQNIASKIHEESEDELNLRVVQSLNRHKESYSATHDNYVNGHCDIVVSHKSIEYMWMAEAKIDNGPAYLYKGFRQLVERYASGEPPNGGLMIYISGKGDIAGRMINWTTELQEICEEGFTHVLKPCPYRPGLSYISEIKHPGSGRSFFVRHIPVNLNWNPPT